MFRAQFLSCCFSSFFLSLSLLRYALGESLGVGWGDTYPTGYGFYDRKEFYSTFSKGPFFPSVHSGDRPSGPASVGGRVESFLPDIARGNPQYTHKGWYSLEQTDKTGQTSIWFK